MISPVKSKNRPAWIVISPDFVLPFTGPLFRDNPLPMLQLLKGLMSTRYSILILLSILILSFSLNIYNIDFPAAFHGDETKKIKFVVKGTQDFHNPILMLQVARMLKALSGIADTDDLLLLCRSTSAFYGTLTVFLIFILTRESLGKGYAFLVALGVAVSSLSGVISDC